MATTFKFGGGNWAVKDGYALAYNDENNNFKPLPFDFTRASSATRVNKQGLIETVPSGKPRVDFTDNTSGHLLLEPSRTNLVLESENFNNYFTKISSATITSNDIIAPDGSQSGDKLTKGTAPLCLRRSSQVSIGIQYAFSVYAKKGSVDKIQLDIGDAGIQEFTLTDEWQRFEVTATPPTFTHIDIEMPTGSSGDYIYLFGAQVEQGSYATSYIPTEGSSVTRVAETCGQTVPDGIYGTNELSVIIDFEISGETPAFSNIFNANKSTTSSVGVVRQDSNNLLKPFLYEGGANVVDMSSTTLFSDNVRHKFAVGFKSGDSVLVVKGNVEDTSSATFSNFNFNQIHLNDLTTYFGYHTNIKIYDFKLYNTRLTDTELQNLTS